MGDDSSEKKESGQSALSVILNDRKILLTGVSNSLFEGSMYSFVFMWVPTMLSCLQGSKLPTGLVFSSFMICMSLGGLLFSPSLLLGAASAEKVAVGVFLVSAIALSIPVMTSSLVPVLLAFIVFETCVGTFNPCLGLLRSQVIPDALHGSVMNIFRVPLNVLVVVGTKLTDILAPSSVFFIIVIWLLIGAGIQMALAQELAQAAKSVKKE